VLLVVFATNISPADLVDEAFLRRIQYKVFAENPTVEQFKDIFERCCAHNGVVYEESLVDELLDTHYRPRQVALRGCHPRDLIGQALSIGEYMGQPGVLTSPLLTAAFHTYFVDEHGESLVPG
jgi:SpoVK/Ycf46/Vps4 family AAA+-type ATPase